MKYWKATSSWISLGYALIFGVLMQGLFDVSIRTHFWAVMTLWVSITLYGMVFGHFYYVKEKGHD